MINPFTSSCMIKKIKAHKTKPHYIYSFNNRFLCSYNLLFSYLHMPSTSKYGWIHRNRLIIVIFIWRLASSWMPYGNLKYMVLRLLAIGWLLSSEWIHETAVIIVSIMICVKSNKAYYVMARSTSTPKNVFKYFLISPLNLYGEMSWLADEPRLEMSTQK